MCIFLAVLIVFNRKNKFKWQHPVISQLFVDHHYVLWGPSVTEKPGLENLLSFDSLLVEGHRSHLKGKNKEKKKQSTNNSHFCLCKSNWNNLLWMFVQMSGLWPIHRHLEELALWHWAVLGAAALQSSVAAACGQEVSQSVQVWLQQLPGWGLRLPGDWLCKVIWVNVFEAVLWFSSLTKCVVYNNFMPNIYCFCYSRASGSRLLCSAWQNPFLSWRVQET